MKILFKFASRSRPTKFFQVLDNIRAYAVSNYHVLCSLDVDDTRMNDERVRQRLASYDRVTAIYGNSINKVHAINRDMNYVDGWDILIVVSDDMIFIKPGFDADIIEDMRELFPHGDGVLHYPDSTAKDALMTMSIMDKRYYDRTGYIYYYEYISLWCDNEAMEVARQLGRYRFVNKRLFDHLHPAYGLAQWDEQYYKTESYMGIDGETFKKRKAKNFGLIL